MVELSTRALPDDRYFRFEDAWESTTPPQIEDYLPAASDNAESRSVRNRVLAELVMIDLERRWQCAGGNGAAEIESSFQAKPKIEDYVARFPELGSLADVPAEMVIQEYRVREKCGDNPHVEEYRQRFPWQAELLSNALDENMHLGRSAPTGNTIRVRCPHCEQSVAYTKDASLSDITCGACGSHFNLVDSAETVLHVGAGTRIAKFELLQRVGQGAFGDVWKAYDTELKRHVALKIPRKSQYHEEGNDGFFDEAKTAAQFEHENIVAVHEIGRDHGAAYIVSAFIEGATLAEWMEAKPPSIRDSAKLCATVARALHFAHERGVVHRDVKPGNIMLNLEGRPYIMDFGLAKSDVREVTVSLNGVVLGSPAYMSPEQARGEAHDADRRSDVYSLGVVLFQLITGELPFRGNLQMLIVQILKDEPPRPRKLNNAIPRDLETITLKCLQKSPARRYATAADLADDLENFLANRPIQAKPPSAVDRTVRWIQRNPIVAALSAVVAALLVAVSCLLWMSLIATQAKVDEREEELKEKDKELRFALYQTFEVRSHPQADPNAEIVFRFGLYEAIDWAKLRGKFEPFLQLLVEDISRTLDKPVRIEATIFKDEYEKTIERLVNGKIDFVQFGPASYIEARKRDAGIRLLAMEIEPGDTKHTHPSFVFAHRGVGIGRVSEIRGKRVALADPFSTSTYLMKAQLAKERIMRSDVQVQSFNQHDEVIRAVANGDCDAGLARHTYYQQGQADFANALVELEELDVPNKPWLARSKISDAHFVVLQNCLLEVGQRHKGTDALRLLKIAGFDRATPGEYDGLTQVVALAKEFDDN